MRLLQATRGGRGRMIAAGTLWPVLAICACHRASRLDEITEEPTAAEASWVPTSAQLAWLRGAAQPFGSDSAGAGEVDLAPFGAVVGDARIVSLGEATHGSAEFVRMKHRLIAYLAPRGLRVVALEVGMAEARRVNEYVLTGRGDPSLLLLIGFPVSTPEVLDLVKWLRAWNASGRGPIEFWGFDMQSPGLAMDSVRSFVARTEPGYLPSLDSAYAVVGRTVRDLSRMDLRQRLEPGKAVRPWQDAAAGVLAHIESRRGTYLAVRDSLEVAWALQYARLVLQGAQVRRGSFPAQMVARDSLMAENVEWILAHHPLASRTVLWAHDNHVSRARGWMGGFLARAHPTDMRVFALALGAGGYVAVRYPGLKVFSAPPPPKGTFESAFRASALPRFILDVRPARRVPAAAWLAQRHGFRAAGAAPLQTLGLALSPLYDGIIYFDRVTPARQLPRPQAGGAPPGARAAGTATSTP